jgi:hypothetical protein
MKTILVSLDNGNSTKLITSEYAADRFLDRYGWGNASRTIYDAGLNSVETETAMEYLARLAEACATLGEIPTLP